MWTVYDTFLNIIEMSNSPSAFPNLVYNIIGSVLFGTALCIVIMITRNVIRKGIARSSFFRGFLSVAISLCFATVITGITEFLLKPIPVSFKTTLKPNAGAYFLPYKGDRAFEPTKHKWEGKPFQSPFPEKPFTKNIAIAGKEISVNFKPSDESAYKIKIWMFEGCTFVDPRKLNFGTPILEQSLNNKANFSIGSEFSNWKISSTEKMSIIENKS